MQKKYQDSANDADRLRAALQDARINGDKLHSESELVVNNVNAWVQEQK